MTPPRVANNSEPEINKAFIELARLFDEKVADAVAAASAGIAAITQEGPGVIKMHGAAVAPSGWLLCDGASLDRLIYAPLFSVIGVVFGAVDAGHFNLPDFRGVFPKGAGITTRAAGVDALGAAYAGILGTYLQDKMQNHKSGLQQKPIGAAGAAINVVSTNVGVPNNADSQVTGLVANGAGAPRVGSTTEPQSLGISFIIKT